MTPRVAIVEAKRTPIGKFLGFFRNYSAVELGTAISLGHTIGATGARIVVTLLHEIRRREIELGLATLCVAGGLGMALLVERSGT